MDEISIKKLLKQIPDPDSLMESAFLKYYSNLYPVETILKITKEVLSELESSVKKGQILSIDNEKIINNIVNKLNAKIKTTLSPVINATGIVLHKSLGRAPLSKEIINSITNKSIGYCNLDYDLVKGQKQNRSEHLNELINLFTGAEKSLVVNNNTAAILLIFNTFGKNKDIFIAEDENHYVDDRSKVSNLISQAGCKPTHTKTINAKIIFKNKGLKSNEIETIKKDNVDEIYVINHINSNLLNLKAFGLPNSPSPKNLLDAGYDLVTLSSDKLLGGPQAGIISGKKELIDQLINNPLYKAFSPNKITFTALEATLQLYLSPNEPLESIPVLKMLTRPIKEIEIDARIIYDDLKHYPSIECGIKKAFIEAGESDEKLITLPTYQVWMKHKTISAKELYKKFLENTVVTTIKQDTIFIDPRCLIERDIKKLSMIFEMVLK